MTDQEQEFEEKFANLTEDDRRAVSMIKLLKDCPGWQWFRDILEKQLQVRRDAFELSAGGGMDGMMDREFMRGEIAMLRTVLKLPDDIEESGREGIDARERQLRGEAE